MGPTIPWYAAGRRSSVGPDRRARAIEQLDTEVGCVRARMVGLNEVSRDAPPTLGEIATILRRVNASQGKSLRHLRSINRKMAALGIVAGV